MKESSPSKFSFQYYIDLGNNKISHILITEQSDPYIQASKFCAKEALPSILVTVLGDAMRDQMIHERQLVQARKKKNNGNTFTQGKKQKIETVGLSDTLNTQLKEEACGNLSIWLHDSSKVNERQKNHKEIERANVFESLYNNYKEIQKKKQLSRKKSFESIPFRPQINHLSQKIVLNKRKIEEQMNISRRNTKKSNEKINNPSRNNSNTKISYTVSAFQARLSSKDNLYQRSSNYLKRSEQKRNKLRESIQKKLMESCSFRPKINTRIR